MQSGYMANNIAIFVTYFLEMLMAYIFFLQIGEKKRGFWQCCLIGTAVFLIGALGDIVFNSTVWINAVTFILIHFAFAYFCFEIKYSRVIFYAIILDIFSAATEIIAIFIISVVTNTEITAYTSSINFLIIDAAISKTLYFLTCLVLSSLVKKDKINVRIPVSLYFYPIVVVFTFIVLWGICANYNLSGAYKILISSASALLFFSTITLFIVYQRNVDKENRYLILENEIRKEKTDKNYYSILEHQNKELMLYAHDAKNHLNAIKALNKNEQIDEYLTQMTNELQQYSNTCHSGNRTLDVIISKYATECEMKNIRFDFSVEMSNLSQVNDYDLVTILSNILDNAVEAAEESDEKFITLTTNKVNTYESVVVSNSCVSSPNVADGRLKTTKGDSQRHGFGLKSVIKVLKKYNGDLDWEYDEEAREFSVTMILK